MREMEEGTFVGKAKASGQLATISKKFKLDDPAESKLADILNRYDEKKRNEYVAEIEKHLEVSNRPSAMVMMLLRKLGEGQSLGRPGPPAPGSFIDKQERDRQDKRNGRDK